MFRSVKTIQDVVDWGQCVGCGACYYACDQAAVSLVNVPTVGIRPQFDAERCAGCTKCLDICPGHFLDAEMLTEGRPNALETDHEFGQALEIWEGHAADPEIRFHGSSGGVLTAISLFCLERGGMDSIIHTGMDDERPWLNKTVVSRTRAELIDRAGSRYAPASPCEGLKHADKGEGKSVFIGKPCDAAAATMLTRVKPELNERIGLVLTFFCAGTPSTQGTLDVLATLELTPEEIEVLRYRGEGWPGRFRALYQERSKQKSMSYKDSWGRLTKYRPMRCNLCPDGLGRLADISCGDAWDKYNEDGDVGRSLVLVRTERGRRVLNGAIEAGYLTLQRVEPSVVLAAQPNLLQRRHLLFGRLFGLRLLGIPTPKFAGFSLFRSWMKLPLGMKARTILGTARRAVTRGLWKRQPLFNGTNHAKLTPTTPREKGPALTE